MVRGRGKPFAKGLGAAQRYVRRTGSNDRNRPGLQIPDRTQHLAQVPFVAQLVERIVSRCDVQVRDLRDGQHKRLPRHTHFTT